MPRDVLQDSYIEILQSTKVLCVVRCSTVPTECTYPTLGTKGKGCDALLVVEATRYRRAGGLATFFYLRLRRLQAQASTILSLPQRTKPPIEKSPLLVLDGFRAS